MAVLALLSSFCTARPFRRALPLGRYRRLGGVPSVDQPDRYLGRGRTTVIARLKAVCSFGSVSRNSSTWGAAVSAVEYTVQLYSSKLKLRGRNRTRSTIG